MSALLGLPVINPSAVKYRRQLKKMRSGNEKDERGLQSGKEFAQQPGDSTQINRWLAENR